MTFLVKNQEVEWQINFYSGHYIFRVTIGSKLSPDFQGFHLKLILILHFSKSCVILQTSHGDKTDLCGSVSCESDWRSGGCGIDPCQIRQHSFVEIDDEIFPTVILTLLLIQEGQLSVSDERICTSTS